MSHLTITPNLEIFSTLPCLGHSYEVFHSKQLITLIEALGKVFCKYDMQEHFGVSLVHRHFSLSSNEILVESIKEDHLLSISVPWIVQGTSAKAVDEAVLHSYGIFSERRHVSPKNWCLAETGKLVAFEYVASDTPHFRSPEENTEFLLEFGEMIRASGAEMVLGLRSLEFCGSLGSGWETTPKGERLNLVKYGEQQPEDVKAEEMIKVLWTFDSEGKLAQKTDYCLICFNCFDCMYCKTCL